MSEKKMVDFEDKFPLLWNKFFVALCILAVSMDPLFLYLPVVSDSTYCLGIDRKLAIKMVALRTIVDAIYLIHMIFQLRTAYIAIASWNFGRGQLVIDLAPFVKRYLGCYFIIDILAILPLPQIVVWTFLTSDGLDVSSPIKALPYVVFCQFIPRFLRIFPLASGLKFTDAFLAASFWAGVAYHLLPYIFASHIIGAYWYIFSVARVAACWRDACTTALTCKRNFLYCGSQGMAGYSGWRNISQAILNSSCSADRSSPFDYGIYREAWMSRIISTTNFASKYSYCFWWGLQNLSSLGQGLETTTYIWEILFCVLGLILFGLFISNMQINNRSLDRTAKMRAERQDMELWMDRRHLPVDFRERVRRYYRYRWLETRGVGEESLVQSLPKDLRRDIKCHLYLALVRRVPLFENMDERLLDAICERLKPSLFTESSYIVREGDPVDEMLFIIRGQLESVTTDGGRSGFFNRSLLKEGDFCGEELLAWALDPKSVTNLPSSTRTVRAITEVEAFALIAEELKFVASQFRVLHSRQVQHTFRFYSQQWRTWAACFIQAAWRRYSKRKSMELRRKEEEEEEEEEEEVGGSFPIRNKNSTGGTSYSIGATFLATRFAANALRGVHRNRNAKTARELVKLQKPPEPDFTAEDAD